MQFEQLITIILADKSRASEKNAHVRQPATGHQKLVVGFYLVQFEQEGEDRAKYGEKLLETIAEELKKKKLKGLSKTNLKIFRRFYETYPQIGQAVPEESIRSIGQPVADQSEMITPPQILLQHFSFRHFTEITRRFKRDNKSI